jgi:hypothetical protein
MTWKRTHTPTRTGFKIMMLVFTKDYKNKILWDIPRTGEREVKTHRQPRKKFLV